MQVLAPFLDPQKAGNNNSLVIKAITGDVSVMLTGDIEEPIEKQLVARYGSSILKADLLKVPHHGSDTSSSEDLLDAVSPKYAVIGCAKFNVFGTPSGETLDRLEERSIEYYTTFKNGDIIFVSDGKSIIKYQ